MATVICPRCGHENPADARVCAGCGSPLPDTRDVNEEIRQLRSLLKDVDERLDSLERRQAITPSEPRPVPQATPPPPLQIIALAKYMPSGQIFQTI